jgi:hypothetical protein
MLRRALCHDIDGALEARPCVGCNSTSFVGRFIMSRQPYFPAHSNLKPIYGIAHPQNMTKMAERVGRCIMMFSYVDWQMALLLAAIMKTESEACVAIFLSLRNARAQRDVLIAAGEMTLHEAEKEAFDALLTVYGGLQAQRADIAHGIFGLIPTIEDEAAWIETKNLSKHWIDKFHNIGRRLSDLGVDEAELAKREDERLMRISSVYKTTDLAQLESDIKELWEASFQFYMHLRYGSGRLGSKEFEKLCAVPQIARALAQMRDPKSNPRPAG